MNRAGSHLIPLLRVLAALLLYSGVGSQALAQEAGDHRSLTKVALSAFQLCLAEDGSTDMLSSGGSAIAEAAGQETRAPLLDHVFNRHYYDAWHGTQQAMGSNLFGVERSIHELFAQRLQSLAAAIDSLSASAIYEATGRVLHHLQDMVIPAKVAPIEHHQVLDFDDPDPYEKLWLWKNPRYIWQQRTCRIVPVDRDGLDAAIDALLHATAERSRDAIRAQIPVDVDHELAGQSWESFWLLRDPQDSHESPAFSHWGYLGPQAFPELCRADRDPCERFFNDRYADAVDASARALLLINRVLLDAQPPSHAASDPPVTP